MTAPVTWPAPWRDWWLRGVANHEVYGALVAADLTDTVIWRDFGWDVNYETDEDDDSEPLYVGPLIFDRAQHEAELRHFIDTFA